MNLAEVSTEDKHCLFFYPAIFLKFCLVSVPINVGFDFVCLGECVVVGGSGNPEMKENGDMTNTRK